MVLVSRELAEELNEFFDGKMTRLSAWSVPVHKVSVFTLVFIGVSGLILAV
jgi:hypothetical protein